MFMDQTSTAVPVLTGTPWPWLDEHFDGASGRYSEQSETKKTAEPAHTWVAHTATRCRTDGKPHLITSSRAIYRLQHEVKSEGKLEFTNDYHRRLISTQGD